MPFGENSVVGLIEIDPSEPIDLQTLATAQPVRLSSRDASPRLVADLERLNDDLHDEFDQFVQRLRAPRRTRSPR